MDFGRLKESRVRLLVGAVTVETAQLEIFDSHADNLAVDHIMASGSLPPAFPWTAVQGRHYGDGGIISNSPLELVIERCGSIGKRVFIVDLFADQKPLPQNLVEVWMRRDEIVYAERVRSDVRVRERVGDFQKLVREIMDQLQPEAAEHLRQSSRFIQLMGDATPMTITRIINEGQEGELSFTDIDFSTKTTARHKRAGYLMTKRAIDAGQGLSFRHSRRGQGAKSAAPVAVPNRRSADYAMMEEGFDCPGGGETPGVASLSCSRMKRRTSGRMVERQIAPWKRPKWPTPDCT